MLRAGRQEFRRNRESVQRRVENLRAAHHPCSVLAAGDQYLAVGQLRRCVSQAGDVEVHVDLRRGRSRVERDHHDYERRNYCEGAHAAGPGPENSAAPGFPKGFFQ